MPEPLALYQPEKYKVYQGRGRALGLSTVWNEPELIFNRSQIIQEKAALVGTLYSRQGVNVMLRNLALNPTIRKLYVWGNGTLSNTQFGLAGKNVLKEIWAGGATNFKIEKEIDPAVLAKMRQSVKLIDMSEAPLAELEKALAAEPQAAEPYMAPVSFPPPVAEAVDIFPSEVVGWLVRGRGALDAWSRVVERIMRYGVMKGTQYGYQQRELIGVTWTIGAEDPEAPNLTLAHDWPAELKQTTGVTEESLREYYSVFLSAECPPGIAYTYGNRLMKYPQSPTPIDQIEEVIVKQLLSSPDSRRATATTMVPSVDKDSKEPPCLTQVQALQSGGKLHWLATFRSHDIFKAGLPNAFGLRILQKKTAARLGFEMGTLQITSQSAHIYEQDWDEANKLTRCLYWERPPALAFNPETQADPRGNLVITIEKPDLAATLQGPDGQELLKLKGASAKELGKKIAQLELLSRSDHTMDVAMELQKAELARDHDLEYRQDQPLIF
jgi:thymidylate synthase